MTSASSLTSTSTQTIRRRHDKRRNETKKRSELLDMKKSLIPREGDLTVTAKHQRECLYFMATCITGIMYYALLHAEPNRRTAFFCVCGLILAIGCVCFPAGPFRKPHPLIWRIVFGVSLLYCVGLVYVLCVSVEDARIALKFLDPSLGIRIHLKDYAADCSLSYANLMDRCDRFIIAHVLGWFFKTLLIRNRGFLWFASIFWELMELSTYYFIPNFAECWWDSWVYDVLLSNGVGIELGLLFVQWRGWEPYTWSVYTMSYIWKKIKSLRYLKCFGGNGAKIEFESHENVRAWFMVIILFVTITGSDMNAFLLKLWLWIPTEHPWNMWRLWLMLGICIPSAKQWLIYSNNKQPTRLKYKTLGGQVSLYVFITVTEILVIWRHCPDMPPAPLENKICWVLSAIVLVLWHLMIMTRITEKKTRW